MCNDRRHPRTLCSASNARARSDTKTKMTALASMLGALPSLATATAAGSRVSADAAAERQMGRGLFPTAKSLRNKSLGAAAPPTAVALSRRRGLVRALAAAEGCTDLSKQGTSTTPSSSGLLIVGCSHRRRGALTCQPCPSNVFFSPSNPIQPNKSSQPPTSERGGITSLRIHQPLTPVPC